MDKLEKVAPVSSQKDLYLPLPREEVIKAVERRKPVRIPLVQAHWWGEGLEDYYGKKLQELERFPEDAAFLWIDLSNYSAWNLPWTIKTDGPYDARPVLEDWNRLDEFITHLPDPEKDARFDDLKRQADQAHQDDRYVLFACWRLFFERPWEIRGMRILFMDYHQHPNEVHRLHEALCQLYLNYLKRAVRELHPDGYWTSDDLGHQKQVFMSPKMFRELLKPYYLRIGNFLHEHKLHWWLHSCGNNTLLLSDLVDAGVDVFHPVQKGTMDETATARKFGGVLTFLAGVDVQHVLQEADPEGVRVEVRKLIDIYDRPKGGMCIAAGNGILPGTPFENIEAFLDEAVCYGAAHRRQWQRSISR
jgi:uroporphyrinogen decarboxylase